MRTSHNVALPTNRPIHDSITPAYGSAPGSFLDVVLLKVTLGQSSVFFKEAVFFSTAALSTITAAVVGVILNLAIWFSLHTMFKTVTISQLSWLRLQIPEWSSINVAACAVAVLAFLLTFRWKFGMATTLAVCCLVGAVLFEVT